ncbi:MAG: hypothetical protein ACK45B_00010 [Limisphaerales bacterium]
MRRFTNILTALAALLWLPVSAHCQLEAVSGLEFLRCVEEVPASHHAPEDCNACCAIEKSQYRAEQIRLSAPIPELLPVFLEPILPSDAKFPAEVSVGILTAAPPELPGSWCNFSRTALPPRAPSFVS